MALSYLWHDYETFGLNPRRDRPAQFAAIRTDSELNVIGEPVNIFCKPLPDMVPYLEACLVTGITPQHCGEHGLPEPVFADRVQDELGRPDTVGVGFNTIKFDDEMTRNLFWRNLMDPYAREWKNGCGRWDIMDVVRVAYAFRPDGIKWPVREDGTPSFKLEHIARENGIIHETAHDALSDVMATIEVARLVRRANPKLYEFCFGLRKKEAVAAQIGFGQKRPFLHVSGGHPMERGGIGVMYPIAQSHLNKNEYVCWNLLGDPSELLTVDPLVAKQTMFKKAADMEEGETRLALRTIATNKSPMVFQDMRVLSPARAQQFNIDLDLIQTNLEKLQAIMAQRNLPAMFRQLYARDPAGVVDPEDDLYGAFVSDADRMKLNEVRRVFMESPEILAAKLHSKAIEFSDPRLTELVFRLRARHAPHTLNEAEKSKWHAFARAKVITGAMGDHTVHALAQAVHGHTGDLDERGQAMLVDLADYADQVAHSFGAEVVLALEKPLSDAEAVALIGNAKAC